MTERLDSVLEQCLSQISDGKATVSSCLNRYPHLASALEPMLFMAEELWFAPKPELSPEARTRIEERVLAAVEPGQKASLVQRNRGGVVFGRRIAALGLGGVLIALFLFTLVIPSVGDAALPSLYRLRWAAEDTWLYLAPRPQEPRLQLTFVRRRLDEVEALTERGTLDPSVVNAMTQATEAALTDVQELPALAAVPLVDELVTLIAEQQETLSELHSTAPLASQDGVKTALQANAEQKSRAQALVSSLPMPPVLTVSEVVSPTIIPEPGGVAEFTVRVINDGAEAVTLTSITNGIRGDPNEQGSCVVSEQGLRLMPGDSFECAFSAFVFHDVGSSETDTVMAVAVDGEGNIAQVSAAASVTIADAQPTILVSTTADPGSIAEPADTVRYAVEVHNKSPERVMLSSLVHDVHGDLNGQGSCAVSDGGRALEPGETYLCTFSADVLGNSGETTTGIVTAVAIDDEGNQARAADATMVTITDARPRIMVSKTAVPGSLSEPGGIAQFTVRVTNLGVEEVTLSPLVDSLHGDLSARGSCKVGSVGIGIGPGESYECTYRERVDGNAGFEETGTATAVATDDEGNRVTAYAGASVTVTDEMPAISVSKTADRAKVPEPGGQVEYAIVVANNGAEPVALTSLSDDLHGDLRGRGTCLASRSGAVLEPGRSYKCAFNALVSGNAGDTVSSSVTVTGVDDEENETSAAAAAAISVVDVLPRVEVSRSVSPENVPEPGGSVRFSVGVTNAGEEDLSLVSLLADKLGDLSGRGTCRIPPTGISLASGESYRCAFGADVLGNAGNSVEDTLVAAVIDDEGNRVRAAADVAVVFSDALPAVTVIGSASPKELPEPGGAVQYKIVITNEGAEAVVLSGLRSEVHGDLNGRGTCSVPVKGLRLTPGATYACSYGADLVGDARTSQTNTVTIDASDDEGNKVEVSSGVEVAIGDLLPAITVVGALEPSSMPEPGGKARLVVQVANDGVESFRLASLRDMLHGNLNGRGTCLVPMGGILLRAGSKYECGFDEDFKGNGGDSITNVITARGIDDDGSVAEASSRVTVGITDAKPAIAVVATAAPTSVPESGGLVSFTMQVTNPGIEDVVLTSLADDVHGDLQGFGTCLVPSAGIQLRPGEGFECTFPTEVTGDAGQPQVNALIAHAFDDEGNQVTAVDSAMVAFTDVPPVVSVVNMANPSSVPEPGGEVEYILQVTNQSGEDVKLVSVVDDVYGDLSGRGSCSMPSDGLVLAAGEAYRCDFRVEVTGEAGAVSADTMTIYAVDDEGNGVEAADSTTVTITDVPPVVAVVTAAMPSSLPEPGGLVEFSIRVANQGAERITLTSLLDDAFGDLNGRGTCSLSPGDTALDPSEVYECRYSTQLSGDAGGLETNVVRVSASDDDGNSVEVVSTVEVAFTDLQPTIKVVATATPHDLSEQGGEVDFALQVANVGLETVSIVSLLDPLHGDLNEQGTCHVPTGGVSLDPGEGYECSFPIAVVGISGDSHTLTVRVVAVDNEGNSTEAVGTAKVTITGASENPGTATDEP